MDHQPSTAAPNTDQKVLLFCPHCDHTSPIPGDWNIERVRDEEVYKCPACDETITTRPSHEPLCC